MRYWTLKEAISKVSGQGLSMCYRDVALTPAGDPPAIVAGYSMIDVPLSGQGWALDHHIMGAEPQWSVALATHGTRTAIRPLAWSWPGPSAVATHIEQRAPGELYAGPAASDRASLR